MALSFAQLATLTSESEFQSRVQYALTVAAVNVYSELSSTTGHQARAAYANQVLNGVAGAKLNAACYAVLSNTTIAAEATTATSVSGNSIPDGDIQFAVNSLWNALAGA